LTGNLAINPLNKGDVKSILNKLPPGENHRQ
jgi:hypothetical protein